MLDSKLIKTLRSLSRKELNDFARFFRDGYFRPAEKVVALLDYVLPFKPEFTAEKLSKESAFEVLFAGEAFDDSRIRLLLSDALKVVNQFVLMNKINADPFAADLLLLDHFSQRENSEHTLKRFEEYAKKLASFPFHNANYYYWLFRLEELKNNYYVKRGRDHDLQSLFHGLENFYLLNKLKMLCIRLSHHRIFKKETDEILGREVQQTLAAEINSANPAIRGYWLAIHLLQSEHAGQRFDELFELLGHDAGQLSPPDRTTLSKILENYCIRQINAGNETLSDQLYQLLRRRLSEAVSIAAPEIKTFVTLSLRLGYHEETYRFLKEKKENIVPEEIRNDAFNYSMALFHFFQKNFEEVLPLLQQTEYFHIFYKIGSKKLLIETYYELREWDLLDSAMNAFRVFIHRNEELSDLHKKNNQHFINFLYKLVTADSINAQRIARLKKQLNEMQGIAERQWLEEKLREKLAALTTPHVKQKK
jgi:hypothetical protein